MYQDNGMSACSVSTFDGSHTTSGPQITIQQEQCTTDQPPVQSGIPRSGNKIGHNPKTIRFYQKPKHEKRRFHVLEEAQRRLKTAIDNPFDYPEFHGLMFHDNGRSIRSERLEAELATLLPAIYDTVNLSNMQLGYYNPTFDFINFDYNTLVSRTGMSYWRVERNMRHLKQAGIVDVKKIVHETNDGMRTERVVITVDERIFKMLHLDTLFLEDREKAFRNRQKVQNKIDARQKYLELYRPRRPKVDNRRSKGCQSSPEKLTKELANSLSLRRSYKVPNYNPACDKQVIALAGELIAAKLVANMRDAITLACTKLGKSPPS